MWRNIILIIISISLLVTTLSNFSLKKKVLSISIHNNNISNEIGFLKEDIDQILNNEELAFQSECFKVNPNTELFNSKNDIVFLKDIIKNGGKLFFYYGDQYCDLCYKSLLTRINKYITNTGTKNIIVIAEYSNLRNYYYFLKENEIKADIYYTTKGIGFPAQEGKQPFFFMLDTSFQAKYVNIPSKKYLNNIEKYFGIVDKFINEVVSYCLK